MRTVQKQDGFIWHRLVLVLLVMALAGAGAWLYLTKYANKKHASTKPPSLAQQVKKARAATQPKRPYEGWKAFCSDLGGLCLKYPASWEYDKLTNSEGETTAGVEVNVMTSPSGKVHVAYLPAYEGPLGARHQETVNVVSVEPALEHDFEAISILNVQSGRYYVAESYVDLKSNAFINNGRSKVPLSAGLSQRLYYGPFYTLVGFSNPKKPNAPHKRQLIAVVNSAGDIGPPQFANETDATTWLSSEEVSTAEEIMRSVTYQQLP